MAVAVERLAELVVAEREPGVDRQRGGVEFGAGHYPVMVAAHRPVGRVPRRGLPAEPAVPAVLGWLILAIVIAAQDFGGGIRTLGRKWNTRSSSSRVRSGSWWLTGWCRIPTMSRSSPRHRLAAGAQPPDHRAGSPFSTPRY